MLNKIMNVILSNTTAELFSETYHFQEVFFIALIMSVLLICAVYLRSPVVGITWAFLGLSSLYFFGMSGDRFVFWGMFAICCLSVGISFTIRLFYSEYY